jgi:hypothetical protein
MITPPRDASLDDVGEENFHLKHIRSERERSLPGAPTVGLFCSGNIQQPKDIRSERERSLPGAPIVGLFCSGNIQQRDRVR